MGPALASGDFDGRTRLCSHIVTGAPYVVRIYDKAVLAEEQWMWERVRASIHVQRTLPKHENIVEMVECFETSSSLFILMQLFKSTNLTKQLCGSRFQRLLQTGVGSETGGCMMMKGKKDSPSVPPYPTRMGSAMTRVDHGVAEDEGCPISYRSAEGSEHASPYSHGVGGGLPSIASTPSPRSSIPRVGRYPTSSPSKETAFPTPFRVSEEAKEMDEDERETRVRHPFPSKDGSPPLALPTSAQRQEGAAMYSTVVRGHGHGSPSGPSLFSGAPRGTRGSLSSAETASPPIQATLSVAPSLPAFDPPRMEPHKKGGGGVGSTSEDHTGNPRPAVVPSLPSSSSFTPAVTGVSAATEMNAGSPEEAAAGEGSAAAVHASSGVCVSQASYSPHRLPSHDPPRPGVTVPCSTRSCLGSVFSSQLVRHYFSQVVRGVEHMHAHHVVHLGIAPDHILVNDRGLAKISNLISCCYCTPGTKMNELRGTRHTVAPEILSSDPFDPYLADAWSLGVLLYFMFHGRYPHDGANTLEHIMSHHLRPPAASIPSTAKELLRSLLEPEPSRRLPVARILAHPFFHVESFSEEEEEEESESAVAASSSSSGVPLASRRRSHSHHKERSPTGNHLIPGGETRKLRDEEVPCWEAGPEKIQEELFYPLLPERKRKGKTGTGQTTGGDDDEDDERRPRRGFPYPHGPPLKTISREEGACVTTSASRTTRSAALVAAQDASKELVLRHATDPCSSLLSSQWMASSPPCSMGTSEEEEDGKMIQDAGMKMPTGYRVPRSRRWRRVVSQKQGSHGSIEDACDEEDELHGRAAVPASSASSSTASSSSSSGTAAGTRLAPSLSSSTAPAFPLASSSWGREERAVLESLPSGAPFGVVTAGGGEGVVMENGPAPIAAAGYFTPAPGSFRALMQKHFKHLEHSIVPKLSEGRIGGWSSSSTGSGNSGTPSPSCVHHSKDPPVLPEPMSSLPSHVSAAGVHPSLKAMTSASCVLEEATTALPGPQTYLHHGCKNGLGGGGGGTGIREPVGVHARPGTVSFVSFSGNEASPLAKQRGKRKGKPHSTQSCAHHESISPPLVDHLASLLYSWSSTSPSCSSISTDSPTQRIPENAPLPPKRSRAGNGLYTDGPEGSASSPFSSVFFAPFQGLCPACHRCGSSSTTTRNINMTPYSRTRYVYRQPNTFDLTEKKE